MGNHGHSMQPYRVIIVLQGIVYRNKNSANSIQTDIIIIIDAFYYNKAVGKVHSLDAAFAQQYIVLIFVLKYTCKLMSLELRDINNYYYFTSMVPSYL